MGGGGAATFGMRHHEQFDAIGPLGGPSDWTWLLWFIEKYALGGFCPATNPTCTQPAPSRYPLDGHVRAHRWTSTTGGTRRATATAGTSRAASTCRSSRTSRLQRGNPNGENDDPTPRTWRSSRPARRRRDPWIVGDPIGPAAGDELLVHALARRRRSEQQRRRGRSNRSARSRAATRRARSIAPTRLLRRRVQPGRHAAGHHVLRRQPDRRREQRRGRRT